ncbi:hypothetical protein C2R22_08640 [Salinigranum rubrum]|uniref:DUF2795 domain-containing protein n=1 Tax=Salinigranum rubrum TaxID=755307 RepID=A0A2I8VIE3_9EURY|nr:hypothetical protein [Salinigranum rubrum]AUV81707.1 hypothetical protein C2R22_08640 [Salinigranum rubrum]
MYVESELKLNTLYEQFETLEYPLNRETAAESFEQSTLLMADGQTNLGALIERTRTPTFDSPEDLFVELQTVLPIEAVGEPGQSDGDA